MENKKIALITGASRGIGAEIAKELASDGFLVIINYNKSEQQALSVKDEIVKSGFMADLYKCDVSNRLEVGKMFNYIKMAYGKLDVLVNNAGISFTGFFQDISTDAWQEMVGVNLSSVVYCSQEAVKLMLDNKKGKIINISSMWGITGGAMEVHYSTTKAGVIGLTKALAKEVALSGITVNAVAPGAIMTDMMLSLGQDAIDYTKEEVPLGRIGTTSDVAGVVKFLASEKADYVTGQVISVNGGMVI